MSRQTLLTTEGTVRFRDEVVKLQGLSQVKPFLSGQRRRSVQPLSYRSTDSIVNNSSIQKPFHGVSKRMGNGCPCSYPDTCWTSSYISQCQCGQALQYNHTGEMQQCIYEANGFLRSLSNSYIRRKRVRYNSSSI